MKIFRPFIIIMLLVSSEFNANAQIINIEQERVITDSAGWGGSSKYSFQYTKNGQELWDGTASLHVQYKAGCSLYLSQTEYDLTKSTGSNFVNAGAQHFRFNYQLTDRLTGEIFTQFQFNKILEVKFRWLLGAGPRVNIIKTKPFRLYIAALYMYEHEELYNSDIINHTHRLSSYLSFILKIQKNLSLVNTDYFQPVIRNISDYRILSQTDLKIRITRHFSFLLSYIYTYDAFPAIGVPNDTRFLDNSLIFVF
ncbi:MAG: DUF481 domain-containing protein [Bacteroidia bacterium]|nr:DUF481 domain-containing protein [Bacteroidia bacterium]